MKKTLVLFFCSMFLIGQAGIVFAASQPVTVTVEAINVLTVNGVETESTTTTLTINDATLTASDATNALQWSTNQTNRNITVETDLATPSYTLEVVATGVTGGTAASAVAVSDTATSLVTGISTTAGSCTLEYTATAGLSDGTGSDAHTITFTITA